MNPARGDLVVHRPVIVREGRSNLRQVVSTDAISTNASLPTVFALHVLDQDPGGLLAVRIGEHGWAFALELDRPLRSRLVERVGVAGAAEMELADQALRAVFDL